MADFGRSDCFLVENFSIFGGSNHPALVFWRIFKVIRHHFTLKALSASSAWPVKCLFRPLKIHFPGTFWALKKSKASQSFPELAKGPT